ncbi:MAG TPA: hypothetical protein VHP58_04380 [Alphaproteobacteria bacterium]|nr:hypothetical protein [Alphaproteobacteria bacterium]
MLQLRALDIPIPQGIISYAEALRTDASQRLRARMGVASVNVLYRRPDRPWLLQQYMHQHDDDLDFLPRSLAFIDFWRRELHGRLEAVEIETSAPGAGYRAAGFFRSLN